MKFGVCNADKSLFKFIKECGYDYVEMPLTGIIEYSDEEYKDVAGELEKCGLKAETFNCFFADGIDIVGHNVDYDIIKKYVDKGLSRASALGGEIAVIGSGKARAIPDGLPREKAEDQFLKSLDICGNIAGKYGMKIVIEPLRKADTNFIHTVAEGLEMAKRCNNPNVGCLADMYHMFVSGETLDALENNSGLLWHAHLSRGNDDRRMPVPGVDDEQCKLWASAFKKGGYDARLSLEGNFAPYDSQDQDMKRVIKYTYPMLDYFR